MSRDRARLEVLADCAAREVRMRERVYPRWVQAGRMSQALADAELALMREIEAFLREQLEPLPVEPPAQTSLFGGSR